MASWSSAPAQERLARFSRGLLEAAGALLGPVGVVGLALVALCFAGLLATNHVKLGALEVAADRSAYALSSDLRELDADLKLLTELLADEARRTDPPFDYSRLMGVYRTVIEADGRSAPYLGLLLADEAGRVRFRAGEGFSPAPTLAGSSLFEQIEIDRAGRMLIAAAPPLEDGRTLLVLARRLPDVGGAFSGAVVMTADARWFGARLARLTADGRYNIAVTDGNRMTLARSANIHVPVAPAAARWVGDTPLVVTVRDEGFGTLVLAIRLGAVLGILLLLVAVGLGASRFLPRRRRRQTVRARATAVRHLTERPAAEAPADASPVHESIEGLRARLEEEQLRADAASQVKAEFLAHMSHELRTPLNAIIGFSELMTQELFGPLGHSKYAEYADDIRASGERLLEMINRILEFATLETGRTPLDRVPVDVEELIGEFLEMVRIRIAEAGLSLRTRISPMPRLRADPRALTQVLLHLVSNAIRFTPRGGTVTIAAKTTLDGLVVTVADTGIGISPADLARIGRPFEQVGPRNEVERKGVGLGLALSRLLVEAHGGRLEIKSRPGAGTRVSVFLPRAAAQARPERGEEAYWRRAVA
ncbi:MAG: sensor histidine kinase [Alphaproteobacteria bacterium]|nr:sensor histidine kinase [Alphaproteobacteria bacterium]